MKFLIQRVTEASVSVEGETIGQIGKGFLVLVGIAQGDTEEVADKMVKKLVGLRIFEDAEGKTNLDLKSVGGELLMISQFTLFADCHHGNRPSFMAAGKPEVARPLMDYVVQKVRNEGFLVEQGQFGADMKVRLLNDGPFTVLLDSDVIFNKF